MKKLFGVVLAIFVVFAIAGLSTVTKAEEILGDEKITNGTFTMDVQGGSAKLNEVQDFSGGDWTADGHTYLAADPLTDYCIRMDFAAQDNMYIMVPVNTEAGDIVKVSLDYYIVGTCVNYGLGFWCTTTSSRLLEYVMAGAPTDGWVHAEWSYDPAETAASYDSIHMWCVGQSEGSQAYYKNLKVTLNDDTTNLVTFGDLSQYKDNLGDGSAVLLKSIDGFAAGDWTGEGHTFYCTDPIKDVCVRMDYAAQDNMYIMVPVNTEVGDVVKVSIDYYIVGTCVNYGLGFWCTTTSSRLLEYVMAGAPTDGWVHAEWSYDPAETAASYDSIHMWCVGQSEGSQAYYKNLKVTLNDDTTNLVTSGNLNGFADYLVSKNAALTDEADENGNTGSNATYTGTAVKINNGYIAQSGIFAAGKYQVSVDAEIAEGVEAKVEFADGEEIVAEEVLEAGFSKVMTLGKAATKVIVTANGEVVIDNLSVMMYEEVAASFDGWFASDSTTVNGDFEAFDEGTVLTEAQLEGAWGSVSLDSPGIITSIDGSKTIKLAVDSAHSYSSCFLMLPDTLEVGDVLRLSYDVKIDLAETTGTTLLNSCLVGGSNVSYYLVDLLSIDKTGLKTAGEEKVNYPVMITDKGNGWKTVSFDFQLTSNDLIKTNSIRWLMMSTNPDDKLYIDNVNIYYLTETEPEKTVEVSGITISEGTSISLNVGDTKTITAVVSPENATDKTVTYKSSNEEVATVDATGKIVGVSKGACSIIVTSSNGKTAEIAVVVSEKQTETKKKGCSGSMTMTLFASIALAGALVISRMKDEN